MSARGGGGGGGGILLFVEPLRLRSFELAGERPWPSELLYAIGPTVGCTERQARAYGCYPHHCTPVGVVTGDPIERDERWLEPTDGDRVATLTPAGVDLVTVCSF